MTTVDADRESFLKAILTHPADDVARLVFADWLEEHGEPERAEFIRVQCERARLGECRCSRTTVSGNTEFTVVCGACATCKLQLREQELWGTPGAVSIPEGIGSVQTVWRRGFLTELEITAETWLKSADQLLATNPIERVTLTALPTIRNSRTRRGDDDIWFNEAPARVLRANDVAPVVRDRAPYTGRWDEAMLSLMFPGVEFVLTNRARINASDATIDAVFRG